MTEVKEAPEVEELIREAMQLIDRGLGDIAERQIVPTSEMADLLLDVRLALAKSDSAPNTN